MVTLPRGAGRMLDANGNRAAEGLRVLEDVARFVLDDGTLAGTAKKLRHDLRQAVADHAIADRDTGGDVGTAITAPGEMDRARPVDLVRANAARACEALRAAEEAAKLLGLARAAAAIETVRYATYVLESGLLARFPATRFAGVKLYALVDTSLTTDPLRVAAAVARGGAGAVQLRAKNLDIRGYCDLARKMQTVVHAFGSLFVVNDHVAVARIIAADAVHVGQDDLGIADARAVVGPTCAVGLSCHTPEQVDAAQAAGADYLGLGPMYATTTKPHEPQRGPQLLDAVRERLTRPSYAIGGLTLARLRELRLPHGAAIAGALCTAPDPEFATRELLAVIDGSP